MAIGPTQLLIVLDLSRSDFHGALTAELGRLQDEEIVRVLDVLALSKDANGEVEVRQLGDAGEDPSIAIDCGADVLEEIPTGSSAALVLLEHHWAWRLHDVIASLGGFAVRDGFIISPLDLGRFAGARTAPTVGAGERFSAGPSS
ncbi:MAG TPA: hypothetical protein VGG07_25795 [Solirubrobacteraceae bacterium]|jgi:hypothetical protein